MAAASSDRVDKLLSHLYGAAEVLIESIADPDAIDAAPLNHRAQALDAVSRFIHRLEKVNAATRPAQNPSHEQKFWDPDEPVCHLEAVPVESMLNEEDVDHLVALELEDPGRFYIYKRVQRRLDYLRHSDPVALQLLDPDLAREYFATSHLADYDSLHTVPPSVKPAGRQPLSYAVS